MIAYKSDPERLLPAIWKLLRLRIRLNINSFRHSKLRAKILMIVGLLALGALAGFIFYVSWGLLGFLQSPEAAQYINVDTRALLQTLPVLLLTGLFFGVMFTSFGVLLQALYLAGDMDFLLAAPVPIRAVFVAKLIQAVLPNFGLFALFGLPALYGFGKSGGYNFLYYPLVLFVMVALTLAATGLSSLLVMAVVRVLPPRRAAEILGFIGATAGVICSQLGNFSQSIGEAAGSSPGAVSGALSFAMRAKTLWFPLNWAGQGLVDIGEGRWLPGTALLALTFGLTSVGFWLALVAAERLYYTGWAGMQVVARKRKPVRAVSPSRAQETGTVSPVERLLPGPVRGIVRKDFLMLRRDLRNLAQLISPLIVGIMLSLTFLRGGGEPPPGRGEAPAWFMESFRTLLGFGSVGVSLFVSWILLGRLAGMSFSEEGKSFWVLKASPVSARQMLAAKFLVAYLPALTLGWAFLIVIGLLQKILPGQFLYMLWVVALCLAGLNGILLGFGAAGANFKWDDPRRMNAGGLGCLGQVVTLLLLPLSLGFCIGPLFVAPALHLPQAYGYLAGGLLGAGLNLVCAIVPLRVVERTVRRLDES